MMRKALMTPQNTRRGCSFQQRAEPRDFAHRHQPREMGRVSLLLQLLLLLLPPMLLLLLLLLLLPPPQALRHANE